MPIESQNDKKLTQEEMIDMEYNKYIRQHFAELIGEEPLEPEPEKNQKKKNKENHY